MRQDSATGVSLSYDSWVLGSTSRRRRDLKGPLPFGVSVRAWSPLVSGCLSGSCLDHLIQGSRTVVF